MVNRVDRLSMVGVRVREGTAILDDCLGAVSVSSCLQTFLY